MNSRRGEPHGHRGVYLTDGRDSVLLLQFGSIGTPILHNGRDGQREEECGAATRRALRPDPASMTAYDPFHGGKTDTRTGKITSPV